MPNVDVHAGGDHVVVLIVAGRPAHAQRAERARELNQRALDAVLQLAAVADNVLELLVIVEIDSIKTGCLVLADRKLQPRHVGVELENAEFKIAPILGKGDELAAPVCIDVPEKADAAATPPGGSVDLLAVAILDFDQLVGQLVFGDGRWSRHQKSDWQSGKQNEDFRLHRFPPVLTECNKSRRP